jgi:hypothetical protein
MRTHPRVIDPTRMNEDNPGATNRPIHNGGRSNER